MTEENKLEEKEEEQCQSTKPKKATRLKTRRDIRKPGPKRSTVSKPLKLIKDEDHLYINDDVLNRIERLEFIVRKMAHFSGNNRILLEAGLETWMPGKKDMTRFKNG